MVFDRNARSSLLNRAFTLVAPGAPAQANQR